MSAAPRIYYLATDGAFVGVLATFLRYDQYRLQESTGRALTSTKGIVAGDKLAVWLG